ncbi:MAG: hypothetical protein JXM70_24155, partial [Pirellulales bacterium]|nr:hypothetical protein [Pirellulales bacterium]
FPNTRFATGKDARQLIAWASDEDHARLAEAVEKLSQNQSGENAPTAKTYTLKTGSFSDVIATLRTAVPEASMILGSNPRQMTAWASPGDHEKIAQIVDAVDTKSPAKMVVYTVESATAASLLPALRLAAPRAELSVGTDPNKLVVWATDDDHAIIKAAVDEISKSETGESASVPVVYQVGAVPAARVMDGLRTIVPGALFTMGAKPNQLVAWARPADQEKIKKIVDEMTKQQPGKMVVYTLETTTASAAIKVLSEAFPDTSFAVGTDTRQLIAWVSDEDYERLAEAVKRLTQDQLGENAPTAQVYTLKNGTFTAALPSLRKAVPEAKLILGGDPRQLTAWATPADHKKIAQIVEQMTKIREPVTHVYYFRTANPRTAMTVLTELVPTAKMAVNVENHSLAVSAPPEDHEKIKAAVEQIDREGDSDQAPKLEAHRITSADPAKLFPMLRAFFQGRPEIQLSLDAENESIMALATPRDHEKIRALIAEVEKGRVAEDAPTVEVYSLKNVDSEALEDVLGKLLEKDIAKVQLSVDSRSDQLVAIARPKHHEIIRETIDRMRTEEQTLEIFQLNVIDPSTATLAIDRLFDSSGFGYDPTAPIVDVDEDSQQLFVSATKEQHEKIRKLLAQMGETNLKNVTAEQQRNMRVVPFRGDTRSTIEEIRRIWPQLRGNPIEVVDAEARKMEAKKAEIKNGKKKDDAKKPEKKETEKKKPAKSEPAKKVEPEKPAKKTSDKSAVRGANNSTVFRLVGMSDEKADEKGATDQKEQPATVKEEKTDPNAPVFLIVGTNAITVKSEDPQALEQMESLLRSLAPQYAYGRNIGVFPLQNTDAVRLATRLQEVMVQMRPRWQHSQNRTMIVADDRLNAIVVKGNRADRETIESMVRILDAPESPESLQAKQPTLIPVKNTEASRVEQVVREVFSAQLSAISRNGSHGSRSSRWSPRVSVDTMSNSLIVVADQALLKQIEDLVETLDTAAGDESARGLKIISLQKANASRVEQALGAALQKTIKRRRRPGR